MARIFISYKRVDKERVFTLKNQIESQTGEKCWIDLDGIESDAQFKNVIINAIKQCEVVLFMYSKAHSAIVDFEKDWTVRELNFAAAKNKRIVFINLDGTPLTDEFSFDYGLKQQVDGLSSESVARLISDLKKWLIPVSTDRRAGNHSNAFTIPTDTDCTIMVQEGNDVIEKIYSKGQEVSNKKIETLDNGKKKTFNFSILGKKKGCVVAVSIVASVCLLLIPTYWMFNSPNSQSTPEEVSLKPNTSSSSSHSTTLKNEQLTGIDLGLPSGTLWANMNVGAENASGFGDLFSWGESEIKDSYTEYDYVKETKHQSLEGRHDAAYTILGAEWQTPSVNDFQELIDNCRWKWTSRNGHNGYEVKGRNGNAIFLPASGWIHADSVEYQNVYGYYWTSDRVNDTFAKGLLFSKSEKKIGNGYLYYGRNIRPVKKQQHK